MYCVCAKSLSRVQLFATPWTVGHQAPLSTGFSRRECWSGLPSAAPGDLRDPGIGSPSLALAGGFFLYHEHHLHSPTSPSPISSLVTQMVKRLPAIRETQVRSLGWEDLLEKEMATHSSIPAWRIPGTEEPGSLQSMGLQRVGHD